MLEEIKADIQVLIAAYESQKAENAELKAELEQSKEHCEDCRKRIADLERQIDNLKLASAFLGDPDKHLGAKEKIRKMIKEIDKCITLLER